MRLGGDESNLPCKSRAVAGCVRAGLEIARAGTRIADCCDHLALTMQQGVRVAAAAMLTVAAGQYGWQYLLLGCLLLRVAGFQILWSTQ